jgi:hypothetical protein
LRCLPLDLSQLLPHQLESNAQQAIRWHHPSHLRGADWSFEAIINDSQFLASNAAATLSSGYHAVVMWLPVLEPFNALWSPVLAVTEVAGGTETGTRHCADDSAGKQDNGSAEGARQ